MIPTCAPKRLAAIPRDIEHAGNFYPRDEIEAALVYWRTEIRLVTTVLDGTFVFNYAASVT